MVEFKNRICRYDLTGTEDILRTRGKRYEDYLNMFHLSGLDNCPEKPNYVVLEVNNYCNMRCKMCIRAMNEAQNTGHNMRISMIDKFCDEIAEYQIASVFLGGGAECLINPNINYIINKIREKRRYVTDDVLITNGYALTDELVDLLISLQWEKIFISIDANTESTYKSIRGKQLSHVEENVRRLLEKKRLKHSLFPLVRVSFVVMKENENEMEDFFNKWKNSVDIIDYQQLTVYSSDMNVIKGLPDTESVCTHPFTRLMVDSFGSIYPCCTEYNTYLKIGNINNMTLLEAWNSTFINNLRNTIKEKKLCDVCKTCLKTS